ncbi:uncharacterized protein si:ch211-136m16.8 [Triplophysa dalaica]|uniref:uncharacterized protein si:ch211-136m16.8 n=1 Tax=Triplophysa dalaica TaxID=1582913 RepID=UPI0024E0069B|nr:uncharacterized protein si:ch211-136m16.8 [Triplophysa dalaica]
MDTSEVPVNSIGRTIWTVWGYLTGAVARYLRPEVTNEGNQNVYSEPEDTVLRSTIKQLDGQVKEIAEKEQGEKNYKRNDENTGAVKCLLPEAIVVNEDNNTLDFDTTIKQRYNAAMWCPEGETVIPDVQGNIENEQKQPKSDARIKKEPTDASLAPYPCNKKTGIKTEQELKETEDIEVKDGHNEDTKEESDHYNEDDGETCVMKTEDLDGIEVTIQPVPYGRDQQQKKLINKMDYIETEDTRTEHAKEKMDQTVTKKKFAFKDQERAENDNDEESESPENDEDLLAMWSPDTGHNQEGEIIIPDVQENIENEQKQTKCDARMNKEPSDASFAPYACNKKTGIKTEQELKETEEIEQKDGHNEDTKEESDHYNEDDGETCVMKTEDLDGTEVTIQSVPYGLDQQQKKLINKMDYIETEDTRTEHAKEKMDQTVTKKKIACKDQERAENDNDEESESPENDEDLLAMWSPDTGHNQEGEIIIPDVQENIENEQKQTKCDARMNKEPSDASLAPYACNKKTGIKTEQELKETEEIEQKDGHNEDTKEESDHYNEDDGETCVMKTEDLDGTEVTIQSVPYGLDQQQKKLINKMDYIETEDTRTEHAQEKMDQTVTKKKIACKDQERAENDNDEESESPENDEDLLAMWSPDTGHNQEGEIIIPDAQENIENEQKQTKCDAHVEKEPSDGSLAPYACNKKTGIKTLIETEDTRREYTQEKMDQNVTKKKIACKDQKRTENDNNEESKSLENDEDLLAKLVCSTEDETDLPKPFEMEKLRVKETSLENIKTEGIQTPESQEGIFSKNVVQMPETKGTNEQNKQGHEQHTWEDNCELVDIFSMKEASEKKLKMVETLPRLSKQTFEENVTFNELDPKTTTDVKEGVNKTFDASEDIMQSDSFEFTLSSMLVEATEIEQDLKTPISSMELSTKQIQTLKEMAKFTLKECAEVRTELLVETMKRQIDSEDKLEDFMTANQADNEIFELSTTLNTISESLIKGKGDSSVEINGKERNAEDTPDVTEEKTELIMVLQDNSERHTEKLENMEAEVRLLAEADALESVESLDEMMNQILKETIEMENKFIQELELSSGTSCNDEFQRPTSSALLLEDERGLLGDTVENLVEMVEAGIYEAVNKQKDQHNVSSPECEPTDANRGFKQLEKNTVGETLFRCNEGMSEINRPGLKRRFDDKSKDLPKVKSSLVECSTTADLNVQQSSLDFSVQKSRIAVKNPLVRPPKDPRKLLNKTSMEPALPKPPPCGLLKGRHGVAVSVQSKGVIGFKLPGMVTELHTLRKTEFGSKVREEEKAESTQQKEKSVAETENSVKQEQASLKPKWTPPKHPGMGSPLMMAELKSKLKMPPKK